MEQRTEQTMLQGLMLEGEMQRRTIEKILAPHQIDLSVAASRGGLFLDVGEGTEIAAFAPFFPDPFIATERAETSSMWGDSDASLHVLQAANPSVRIMRDPVIPKR